MKPMLNLGLEIFENKTQITIPKQKDTEITMIIVIYTVCHMWVNPWVLGEWKEGGLRSKKYLF